MQSSKAYIEIPVSGGEVLEVESKDLGNSEVMFQIHKILQVSLFLEFAIESYKLNLVKEFITIGQLCLRTISEKPNEYKGQERQQCALINALISHYLSVARQQGKHEAETAVLHATELINSAARVRTRDSLTRVHKGNLLEIKGLPEKAIQEYSAVLKDDPDFAPAILSMASMCKAKKDYKNALKYFQCALKVCPDSIPDIRLSIAFCFHCLDCIPQARLAYTRALERNPSCVDSLVSLSIIDWNAANSPQCLESDREIYRQNADVRLNKAHELNPTHHLVAVTVAGRLFQRQDYSKAAIVADYVVKKSHSRAFKAEGYAIRGLVQQIEKRYEDSLKSFEHAVKEDSNSMVVRYGLGQMYVFQGNYEKAEEAFNFILEKDPNNYESTKRLASIYALRSESRDKAIGCFDKLRSLLRSYKEEDASKATPKPVPSPARSPSKSPASNRSPKKGSKKDVVGITDPEILIEYGQVYENVDIQVSLTAYLKAETVFEREEESIPAELFNNIGALYHIQGDIPNAKAYYSRALSMLTKLSRDDQSQDNINNPRSMITALYNTGRLCEAEDDIVRAKEIYGKILALHPAYSDANLRLGSLYMQEGKMEQAEQLFSKLVASDPRNVNAGLMLGQCYLESRKRREAKRSFERVLKDIDSHDVYALCQVGNLYIKFAQGDPKQRDVHFRRAFGFFDEALKLDNRNYCAALGIAICFAENGQIEIAKDFFGQIQGSSTNLIPNATINLAHVMTELQLPRQAVALYESVSKKHFQSTDAYILQCIARAYYIIAKTEKDIDAINSSLRFISRATHINPSDMILHFDLALIKQQYAQILNDQSAESRPMELLERAKSGLQVSKVMFQSLGEMTVAEGATRGLGYDIKHAQERANFCKEVTRVTEKKIHETRILAAERVRRMQEVEESQLKYEQDLKLAAEEEARATREKQEKIELQREELRRRMNEGNLAMAAVEDEKLETERKKKSRKKKEVSSEDEDEVVRGKKARLTKKVVVSSDDDL